MPPAVAKPPPRLLCTSAAHRPEDPDCLDRLNRFAADHRLREMKFSGRNINRVIRAAAGAGAAGKFLDGFGCEYRFLAEWRLESDLYTGPFDHGEVWGRSGRPLVLVGHPYHLGTDRSAILRRLMALGLDVTVSRDAGWYGFGTWHVRAAVPGAIPPPTDAERFETEMALV